jgi:hypothetical protein
VQILALGDECPAEFFREVVEPLSDSFDSGQSAAYEQLMRAWIPVPPTVAPAIPAQVDIVYVLSRVTLGSDIKIVSPILGAMRKRFPGARIIFVSNRKSAELFAADPRIEHLNAEYPRIGPVRSRLEFANQLSERLKSKNSIVVDPDSRMTQLGLIPVCEPGRFFHFQSRTAGGDGSANLTDLVDAWLRTTFGVSSPAWIAPHPESMQGLSDSFATVSLGVGENDSKRVGGDFEAKLIRSLGSRYQTILVDRGVGGEEASRVTAAVEASGVADRVRFWEGSFAGFASLIARSKFYAGYDSAGQHAAAAAGVPLISVFAGAPSARFRDRWTAAGSGKIVCIDASGKAPDAVLHEFVISMPLD